MKKLAILVMLLSGVILQNCISDDCDDCKEIKTIDNEARQWFMFGIGSKWVYRLAEDTTVTDTLTCTYIDSSSSNLTNCVTSFASAINCSQVMRVTFTHSNKYMFKNDFDTSENSYLSILSYFPTESQVFLTMKTNSVGVIGSGPFLVIPYNENVDLDYFYVKDTSQSLTIRNKYFECIVYTEKKIIENDYINKVWIKKNIGLIKYSVEPNRTWELINLKIKP